MKKALIILVTLAIALATAACGKEQKNEVTQHSYRVTYYDADGNLIKEETGKYWVENEMIITEATLTEQTLVEEAIK